MRFREILREAVEVHCAHIEDPDEARSQTIAILEFLAANGQTEAYRGFLAGELERLRQLDVDAFDAEFQKQAKPALAKSGSLDNATYHEIAYPTYLHARIHPDQLALMSHVFELDAPPPEKCRMLELGCGTGHSLIAFAMDLRESEFVGVDFSSGMIAEAKATAGRLGLSNVRFIAADAMDVDVSYGKFDYIAAHGFYSWVPEPVRKQLLAICRDLLTPNGIAYWSFNATPGYQLPAILREIGLSKGPINTIAGVAESMQVAGLAALDQLPPHRHELMRHCIEHFAKSNPLQVLFDEFGDINAPFRFSTVCAEAEEFGLRYVTESTIEDWSAVALSPAARQLLVDLGDDPVRRMQYRDLLRFTRFHASIFCRNGQKPSLVPNLDRATTMLITSRSAPHSSNPDVRGAGKEIFESPGGVVVSIGEPLLKSALVVLFMDRPRRVSLEELAAEACQLAGITDSHAIQRLKSWLLPFWETGMIDLHWHMPELAAEVNEHPQASPFALDSAQRGATSLPSLLGCSASLESDQDLQLLLKLDGSHDEASLLQETGLEVEDLRSRLTNFARLGLLLA